MACCLTAPSHYLNQYWLIISENVRLSPEVNFTVTISIFDMIWKIIHLRLQPPWVKKMLSGVIVVSLLSAGSSSQTKQWLRSWPHNENWEGRVRTARDFFYLSSNHKEYVSIRKIYVITRKVYLTTRYDPLSHHEMCQMKPKQYVSTRNNP